jgi:phospholipid transport system substrate-binding protein
MIRKVIASLPAAIAVLLFVNASVAALDAGPAEAVRGFYGALLGTMQAGPSLGPNGRYQRLAPAVARVFDIPLMARLATGPGWTGLSPGEQQQVVAAFGRYVAATYADRFDSYSGERLEVTGQRQAGGNVVVQTRIVKADGDPVAIDYLMHQTGNGWQVADVYLDGTISQLAVQRSEFDAILRRQGVAGLVARLNQKADLLSKTS